MLKKEVLFVAALAAAYIAPSVIGSEVSSQAEASGIPNLELGGFPANIPAAVAKAAMSEVSVEYGYSIPEKSGIAGVQMSTTSSDYVASGFRISPNVYISAGHFVDTPKDKQIPYVNVCGNITVSGPSKHATSTEESVANGITYSVDGTDLQASRFYGSFIGEDTTSLPDISIIKAPDTNNFLPSQPVASVATSSPKVGQKVFFITEQPIVDAKGNTTDYRSPSEEQVMNLDGLSTPPSHSLTEPAIYGGVIAEENANGDFQVVTGEKSYDSLGDSMVQPGGSGAQVVNEAGQVVGTLIQKAEINGVNTPNSRDDFEQAFGINVSGVSSSTNLAMGIVQPLKKREIPKLENKLSTSKDCYNDAAHTQTP